MAHPMSEPWAPEGWQLVPKEPTKEMLQASKFATGTCKSVDACDRAIYAAMLAAARHPACFVRSIHSVENWVKRQAKSGSIFSDDCRQPHRGLLHASR